MTIISTKIRHIFLLTLFGTFLQCLFLSFASEKSPVETHTLDNGLVLIIKPSSGQGLASLYVKVKAGVSSENEYVGSGITHFIEHMIFKGSKKTDVGELAESIRTYGGDINATTGLDTTTFFVTLPSQYIDEGIELLCDVIMNPVFDENEFEKERSVILNELRLNKDEPSRNIMKTLFETAYTRHPYRFPVIGYEDLFKRLKREDLVSYHTEYYVPNNMVIAVVGDVTPEAIVTKVEETFGEYERRPSPFVIVNDEPEQVSERIFRKYADVGIGYLAVGYHSTGVLDRDLFALDVLAIILGYGDGSRLNERVVKEKELLFSIGSGNYTPFYPGLFLVNGMGDPEKLERAVFEIKNEIEEIKINGVSKVELEKAKAVTMSQYIRSQETVESQAGELARGQMFTGDPEFFKKYVEGISNVGIGDIQRVVTKYLTDANSVIVYLLPHKEAFEGDAARKQTPATETKEDALREIHKYTLENGIRIILREEHELPLVSITCVYLGGLRTESQNANGVSSLTNAMLLKGTKARKESEIKPVLEAKGGSIHSFSGMNSLGISIEVLKADIGMAFDILEDVIKNPIFPEEELEKLKVKIEGQITREENDTFAKGLLELRKGIFKDHPYGRRIAGQKETIARLSRGDVEKFYRGRLDPKNFVVSIVGDFNSDAVYADLAERFSDIGENASTTVSPERAALKGKNHNVIYMPKEESAYLIGFDGVTVKDNDKYKLATMFAILSGQGGRLYKSLREELGISYTQGGVSIPGIDPGYCFLYVAAGKEEIEKAKRILLREISKIRTKLVSDDELASAKNLLIGQFVRSLQTNRAKAFTMSLDELYSLGYDNYADYAKNITKCTKRDILNIAQEYLDPGKSFSITILPFEKED